MSEEPKIDEREDYERWLLDAEDEERRNPAFWREQLCVLLDEVTHGTRPDIPEIVARAPLDMVRFLCTQILDDRFFINKLQEHRAFKRQSASNDPELWDATPEGEVVVLHGIHDALNDDPTTWETRWSRPFRAWLARRREREGGGPPRPGDLPPGDLPETGASKVDRYNLLFIALMIVLGVVASILSRRC